MTSPIRPPGAVERRTGERRQTDVNRRSGASSLKRALIPTADENPTAGDGDTSPPSPGPAPAIVKDASPAAFAAQLLGQKGSRRGLKGGPPVLGAARTTYLETEYSGRDDRRPPKGQRGKTDA